MRLGVGRSVYGSDKSLRVMLESRDTPYVLAVRGNVRLIMGGFSRTPRRISPLICPRARGAACLPARDRKARDFMIGRVHG